MPSQIDLFALLVIGFYVVGMLLLNELVCFEPIVTAQGRIHCYKRRHHDGPHY